MQILLNGKAHEVPGETTVADLMESLGLRTEIVAVEVNEGLVARARRAEHCLAEGDRVEIVTLVGGG
jgi:thiamine biosynthesis protein ThiS